MSAALAAILPPLPEWERTPGYITITKDNFHDISQRASGDHLKACLLIAERTRSARKPRPVWAEISIAEFEMALNKSDRAATRVIADLENWGWVVRECPEQKTRRGGFKLVPQNFRNRPIPPRKARKRKPRTASVLAPVPLAAMRVAANGICNDRCTDTILQVADGTEVGDSIPPILAESFASCSPLVETPETAPADELVSIRDLPILPKMAESVCGQASQGILPRDAEYSAIQCPIGLACPYTTKDLKRSQTETEESSVGTNRETTTTGPASVVVVVPKPDVQAVLEAIEPHGQIPEETVEGLLQPHPPGTGVLMAQYIRKFRFTGNERSRVAVLIPALRRWKPPVEARNAYPKESHTGLDPGRREMLERIVSDPDASDEEKQCARDLLQGD